MRRIFGASAGSTCTERRRWRIRFGFFVPNKWRLNACGRMILPFFVTRKRLAAPRCVFSLRTFGFAFDNSAPVALSQFHKTAKSLGSKDPNYIMLGRLLIFRWRPFWGLVTPAGYLLPCAARIPPAHARRYLSADA